MNVFVNRFGKEIIIEDNPQGRDYYLCSHCGLKWETNNQDKDKWNSEQHNCNSFTGGRSYPKEEKRN